MVGNMNDSPRYSGYSSAGSPRALTAGILRMRYPRGHYEFLPMKIATLPSTGATSLTTQAFGRLRADIMFGVLRPSERLRINALVERYGIGATAIREALSRLVTEGLVQSEDQRGFSVSGISKDEFIDLTRTRIDVECIALGHAIERGGIDWESDLVSSFHRVSRISLPVPPELHAQCAEVHTQFHTALIAGCESPWTMKLCKLVCDKLERYRNLAIEITDPQQRDPNAEHRQLMEAALARDAPLAKRLLAEHLWTTAEIVMDAVFEAEGPAVRGLRANVARRATI